VRTSFHLRRARVCKVSKQNCDEEAKFAQIKEREGKIIILKMFVASQLVSNQPDKGAAN
jgi:hypothetical protein